MLGLTSVSRINPPQSNLQSYDNAGFSRGSSISSKKGILSREDIELNDESFLSDLERDSSAHSSMNEGRRATDEYEKKYLELQRRSHRKTPKSPHRVRRPHQIQQPRYPILDTAQIQIRLEEESRRRQSKVPKSDGPLDLAPTTKATTRERPAAKLSNLFGVIDTSKLKGLCSSGINSDHVSDPKSYYAPGLEPIPEASAPPEESLEERGGLNNQERGGRCNDVTSQENPYRTHNALFYGSIASFVSGVLLLMSFASPYWLQSWEDTQSPFKNMGLWEFCFYKFRHPDYQFDHLFHGCHALYGDEYRLIREKLLPGWLMVVQLFVTLALIASFLGQVVIVCLLLRAPLEWILRFEWYFCGVALVCKGVTALLLFLSICIFGGACWDRDWLLYPNYNYVSWSYAFAVFSTLGHIIATFFMFVDCGKAKERKEKNKALILQMHPQAYSSTTSSYHHGLGYI